jgi:hypothetical protein
MIFAVRQKGKMMTKRKLIYLDDALEAIRRLPNAGIHWLVSAEAVFDALLKLPSVQPEIIYCRDCKYYIPYEWMFDGIPRSSDIADYTPDEIGCSINDHIYQPDGFCSHAERREE